MSYIRLQNPRERREILVDTADPEELGDLVASYRDEMGFPEDWVTTPDYDCVVDTQPVHGDYWRSLGTTQAELRATKVQLAQAHQQLVTLGNQLVEMDERLRRALNHGDLVERLEKLLTSTPKGDQR
jgi:N-acyl-D-aspartate/D-glutamate deacylase